MLWTNWLNALRTVGVRRLAGKVSRRKPARFSKWMWQQVTVAPGTELLEARQLLSAFNENGMTLDVEVSSGETVTVVSTGTTYQLTSSATWSGTDSSNVTGNGTSTLTVTAAGLTAFDTISISDSADNAAINFGNSGSNSYSDNFVINFDNTSPGSIQFASGSSKFADGATLGITTNKNVEFVSGSSLTMVNGDLTILALGTASGAYSGIALNDADIATASGAITLIGKGGNSSSANRGIFLQNGSSISSSGTGTVGAITLNGTGGSTDFGAPGVEIRSNYTLLTAPSSVTSVDANISISGTGGGGTAGTDNYGVTVRDGSSVSVSGSGNVSLEGTGGTGTQSNYGVYLSNTAGLSTTTASVTTNTGDISVFGADGVGSNSEGVAFTTQSRVVSTLGDITVRGPSTVSIGPSATVIAVNGTTTVQADRLADGSVDDGTGKLTVTSGGVLHGVDIVLDAPTITLNSGSPISSATTISSLSTFTNGIDRPTIPTFDAAGNLYVPSWGTNTVKKSTPAGAVTNFITTGLSNPGAIVFDASGNAYVSNQGAGLGTTVSKYDSNGTLINANYVTGLNQPLGMTFDSAGNLYIASSGDGTVRKVTPAGAASTVITGATGPRDVAFDAAGNLYVAAQQLGTIRKYDSNFNLLDASFATGVNPSSLEFDNAGNLYVSDFNDIVRKITPDKHVTTYASGFSRPEGIVFDANGVLHVTNFNSGTVHKVTVLAPATESLSISGGAVTVAANIAGHTTTIATTGTSTISGTTTASGSLTVDNSAALTISGVISGAAGMTKEGAGTLTLSAANTYSGGTTLSAGTLVTTTATGFGTGSVTINDANTGASNTSLLWSFVGTLNNNISIANQGTGTTTIGSVDGSTGAGYINGLVTLNKDITIQAGNIDRTDFTN